MTATLRGSPPATQSNGNVPKLGKVSAGIDAARIILNAVEGFGKTTFGAYAPKPAVLMARGETGFVTLRKANRVPDGDAVELTSWNATLRMVESLAGTDYQSVVIDALGGFERLCHEHVCARDFNNEWGEKGFQAYMRGYDVAVSDWLQLLVRLERLHGEGKNIIFLSHVKAKTFKNPLGPDFDRYTADCHEKTWSPTHKWADVVLFGTFATVTQERKGRTKGIGGTERVIFTERTDGYDAKNRYGMPGRLDIPDDPAQTWATVWPHISGEAQTTTAAADVAPEL